MLPYLQQALKDEAQCTQAQPLRQCSACHAHQQMPRLHSKWGIGRLVTALQEADQGWPVSS
jgi:hypothetical protein